MKKDSPEIEIVESEKVSCDGGGGAQGHPKVWYIIPPEIGWVVCGYCDKKFILAKCVSE